MLFPLSVSLYVSLLASTISMVRSHGRLMEPPSRSSMWRVGFKTPRNYNDNELFCGGFTRQLRNGMKCGVCGDPWDAAPPRANEAGGKYATGMIGRRYRPGQVIETAVELTANHMGHFEFRLCPVDNALVPATDECMAKHPLEIIEANSSDPYRYFLTNRNNRYRVRVKLPSNISCSQCVFQWTYTAGNNWGRCSDGLSRVGCGPQETFRGCSDIAILNETGGTDSTTAAVPSRPGWKTTEPPSKRASNTTKLPPQKSWKKATRPVVATKSGTAYPYEPKTTPRWQRKPSTTNKWYHNFQTKKPTLPKDKYPSTPNYWTSKPSWNSPPGLEKEEGPLPMIPPLTKMHGHYPEPTTVRATRYTEATTTRRPFSTPTSTNAILTSTARTRFTPILKSVTGWIGATTKPNTIKATTKSEPENEIPSKVVTKRFCTPVGVYSGSRKMQQWCNLNCLQTPYYCPRTHCKCA